MRPLPIPLAVSPLPSSFLLSLCLRRPLLTGYALTLIAVAFSVYLTYREVFTIHAICSWCVSSAVVFTLLAIVGSRRVLHPTYGEAGPAPARA